jgi:hypothetical protein
MPRQLRAVRIDEVAALPAWIELLLELEEVLVAVEGVEVLEEGGHAAVQRPARPAHVGQRCVR